MRKPLLLLFLPVLLTALALPARAQQFPLYTQYFADPYLINPSLVGSAKRPEVNALYRQQWTGIKDGPRTLQFDLQYPIDKRIAIGINIYDDKTVLLSNTSTMLTFGYKVPLATDHILAFGLSAGVIANRIRMEEIPDVDSNDPALFNSANNNLALDGQFGVSYSFKNLVIGYSVNNLIKKKTFTEDQFQEVTFNSIKNNIAFITYRFNISENISFQPNFAYHFTQDNLKYFDAAGLLYYKDVIGVGGGYRENFGPSAILRLSWKDLNIGYAYDFPSNHASVSTGGTNEVQLKYRFGKLIDSGDKKDKKQQTPQQKPVTPVIPEATPEKEPDSDSTQNKDGNRTDRKTAAPGQTQPQQNDAGAPTKETNKPSTQPVQPTIQPADETPEKNLFTGEGEWHLVVGTFEKKSNAEKQLKALKAEGMKAELRYDEEMKYYYVHLPDYSTQDITLDKVMQLRKNPAFKEAWFKRWKQ